MTLFAAIEWKDVLPSIIGGCFSLLAAGLAFWGLMYSLERHSEREEANRRAALDRERISREIEMRRQVYFDLAEAVAKVINGLNSLSSPEVEEKAFWALLDDYGAAAAKFSIVAPMDGIQSLYALTAALGAGVFPIFAARAEMLKMHRYRASVLSQYEIVTGEINALHRSGQLAGNPRSAELRGLATSLKETEQVAALMLAKASFAVQREAQACTAAMTKLTVVSVLQARAIFGFPIDEQAFRDFNKTVQEKTERDFAEKLKLQTQKVDEALVKLGAMPPPGLP